ncbi:MAG: signal recognition particle-docking protein FtsY [Oscillospiraceae bacterium]
MGLFDKFKKKNKAEEEKPEQSENLGQAESTAEVSENPPAEEENRPSLLERLQGGTPIFTDHESDIQFQEEYEKQQKELASYKLREGLKKTKDGFVSKVEQLLNSFTKIDEDFFDELEETLILSDIGAETSMEICDKLRAEVKRTGTTEPAEVKQMLKNIISEMLSGGSELNISTKPSVIMVIGVNGAGKTTTIGKMAANFKNSGKKVIVAAADTFRAAAIDQLNVWTDRAGVDIVKHSEGADPAAVVFDAISAAKARGADIVLCDTAGRLHNKKNLMEELKKIARVIARELPEASIETLLVLDATTGQNAVNQAKLFNESADITGIVLTKLDGTAKGGIIIPIKNELGLSVKLVGVGEKIDDLQPFNPEDYVEALFE